MMPGRRYSEGLHQALEAKEDVQIQPENQTLASITFQNYFRLYDKLAGMTGTAATEAAEFGNIYKLDVVEIPTNLPVQRIDEDDEVYRTVEEKYKAIIARDPRAPRQAASRSWSARSRSRNRSMLAERLRKEGVKHFQVLNARYHEQEAYHRRPGRRARRGHHRHQHGRPRHRHPARRQLSTCASRDELDEHAETGPERDASEQAIRADDRAR